MKIRLPAMDWLQGYQRASVRERLRALDKQTFLGQIDRFTSLRDALERPADESPAS